ncbi:unnamed protein product [Cuscuta campestris]|uniref:Uncharacterized protein n=1 Tax=Cuscuta campestris TaxID=132261 RepID=A0A484MT37_9ASTE|nr:unnamed protein product [Cuscuta campestris]
MSGSVSNVCSMIKTKYKSRAWILLTIRKLEPLMLPLGVRRFTLYLWARIFDQHLDTEWTQSRAGGCPSSSIG